MPRLSFRPTRLRTLQIAASLLIAPLLASAPVDAAPPTGGLIHISLSPPEGDGRWYTYRNPVPVSAVLYARTSDGTWAAVPNTRSKFASDDAGNYVGDLGMSGAPGDPYLYSIPSAKYRVMINFDGYLSTTWPAASSVDAGEDVAVLNGDVALTMRMHGHVGTVAGSADFENGVAWWQEGFTNWSLALFQRLPDGSFAPKFSPSPQDKGVMLDNSDSFHVSSVPPGTYRVGFYGPDAEGCEPFGESFATTADGSPLEITVTPGTAVKDVDYTIPFIEPQAWVTTSRGGATVGSTLTVGSRALDFSLYGKPLGVSWYADGRLIRSGQRQLTVRPDMAGAAIQARVTGNACVPVTEPTPMGGYFSDTDTTVWTSELQIAGNSSDSPSLATIAGSLRLKGKSVVGRTLRVTRISKAASYRFIWYANKRKLRQETRSRLPLSRILKNKKMSVKVSVTVGGRTQVVVLRGPKVRS